MCFTISLISSLPNKNMRCRPNVGLLLAHFRRSLTHMQWAHNVGVEWEYLPTIDAPLQTLHTPTLHMYLCSVTFQVRDIQECPDNFHHSSAALAIHIQINGEYIHIIVNQLNLKNSICNNCSCSVISQSPCYTSYRGIYLYWCLNPLEPT